MKLLLFPALMLLVISCGPKPEKKGSEEFITSIGEQDSIFTKLMQLTLHTIPDSVRTDSMAILILPIEASCPSCRGKTIDSIVKQQDNIRYNHFIVISGKAGRKMMGAYFKEEGVDMPEIPGLLFLDSTNLAYKFNLYADRPTVYYAVKQKVYKKVGILPATVREDLREFFSGFRKEI